MSYLLTFRGRTLADLVEPRCTPCGYTAWHEQEGSFGLALGGPPAKLQLGNVHYVPPGSNTSLNVWFGEVQFEWSAPDVLDCGVDASVVLDRAAVLSGDATGVMATGSVAAHCCSRSMTSWLELQKQGDPSPPLRICEATHDGPRDMSCPIVTASLPRGVWDVSLHYTGQPDANGACCNEVTESFALAEEPLTVAEIVAVAPSADTRVVIGSPIPLQPADLPQTKVNRYPIVAAVDPPVEGLKLWFTVFDPPPGSTYEDPSAPNAGTLGAGSFDEWPGNRQLSALTESDGTASVTLWTDVLQAGDNYRVYVAGSPLPLNIEPSDSIQRTGILVNHRRIYMERDRMFRSGGLLGLDIGLPANTTHLVGQVGDGLCTVRPFVDRVVLFATDDPIEYSLETGVVGDHFQTFRVDDICDTTRYDLEGINVAPVTHHHYKVGYADPVTQRSAGWVLKSDLQLAFDVDLTLVEDAFGSSINGEDDGAFTEFVDYNSGHGMVPFRPNIPAEDWPLYAAIWRASPSSTDRVHVIAANREGPGGAFGRTDPVEGWVYIYEGAIEAAVGAQADSWARETVVHEFGHFWFHGATWHHCAEPSHCAFPATAAACDSTPLCVMNSMECYEPGSSLDWHVDGVTEFGGGNSEHSSDLFTIRQYESGMIP